LIWREVNGWTKVGWVNNECAGWSMTHMFVLLVVFYWRIDHIAQRQDHVGHCRAM
jgi:hypothetical protein